jgi:fatty-acyl-CoA synthase
MLGTMMNFPLTLQLVFERGTRLFPDREIVTGGLGDRHRYTYRDLGQRVQQLASALQKLGVRPGDRVGTFSWNHYRHLELYFAVPLQGAVLHTLNIRLFHDQLTYIVNHAEDRFICVDRSLLPIIRKLEPTFETVEKLIVIDDGGDNDTGDVLDYEQLLSTGAKSFDFPRLDENTAAMMCYTSGTTGNPKGVAYSHRALTMHAFGARLTRSAFRSATPSWRSCRCSTPPPGGWRTRARWSAPSRSSLETRSSLTASCSWPRTNG